MIHSLWSDLWSVLLFVLMSYLVNGADALILLALPICGPVHCTLGYYISGYFLLLPYLVILRLLIAWVHWELALLYGQHGSMWIVQMGLLNVVCIVWIGFQRDVCFHSLMPLRASYSLLICIGMLYSCCILHTAVCHKLLISGFRVCQWSMSSN